MREWVLKAQATALVGAAFIVAACGGGSSSGGNASGATAKQQIRSTLSTYYTAFAQGNGARACDQLSTPTRSALEQAAHGKSCAAAVSQVAHEPAFAALRKRISQAHISAVTASAGGGKATVTLGKTSVPVSLVLESGTWKISSQSPSG
jgi:hypothetical protein